MQLENNGDPFYDYSNSYEGGLHFWDGFYYVLISMTTIGYGDISPQTVLGKAFTVVFVVAALVRTLCAFATCAHKFSDENKRQLIIIERPFS